MNKVNGCVALAVVGLALVVAAYVWPSMAAVHGDWGEQQGREYTEAAQRLHQLRHAAGGDHEGQPTAQVRERDATALAAAEQEYERQRESLARARQWRSRPATWLKWTGATVAVC